MALAFQINTDIGIIDDSTDVMEAMEQRWAQVIMAAASQPQIIILK